MHESGFTKLFSTIITSSVWSEDDQTRIVWITLLALANRYGEISATIPGISRAANIPIPKVEKALKTFQEPDKYSRSKEYGGRRIKEIEGGWLLLNYAVYREKTRKNAEYYRQYRANKAQPNATGSNQMQPEVGRTEADVQKQIIYRLSCLLLSLIRVRKPDYKEPNLKEWARHIDLMIHIDKRQPESIEAVIRWCQQDAGDGGKWKGWQNNILSTAKLREKFDILELQMKEKDKNYGRTKTNRRNLAAGSDGDIRSDFGQEIKAQDMPPV